MDDLEKYRIEQCVLDNGLRVIVKRLLSGGISGVVAVRCGSIYETKGGNNGISHFLEHLIYSGGIRRSRRNSPIYKIEKTGADVNPTTSRFWTEYPFNLLQRCWKSNFRMLLDTIGSVDFSKAIFLLEQKIVANEKINDTDDLDSVMESRIFPRHSFSLPVDGIIKTVNALTPRRLKNWHRRFYRPERTTVIVVGDTSIGEVVSIIKKTAIWQMADVSSITIKEPPPAFINWDASSTGGTLDTNAMRIVFSAPVNPCDIVLFYYIVDMINDLSVVGMGWKIIQNLGLHEGMGIDEDKNIELNSLCNYFVIDFWAPSHKRLRSMERAFFSWVKKVNEGGLTRNSFVRIYNQHLEYIRLGVNDERWWGKLLAKMVTQNFSQALEICINPDIHGAVEIKKEVDRVFRATVGDKHVVFRNFKK